MKNCVAIELSFESLKGVDPRNAAEYAYALAVIYRRDGNIEKAIHFGHKTIILLDKCRMDMMEDCTAHNVIVEGIVIPDFFHQDVVRDRLQPLKL